MDWNLKSEIGRELQNLINKSLKDNEERFNGKWLKVIMEEK